MEKAVHDGLAGRDVLLQLLELLELGDLALQPRIQALGCPELRIHLMQPGGLQDEHSQQKDDHQRTGLSDIRLLRRWADRTLQTISVLERGQQDGDLRTLLSELAEFSEIVHAHDAEMAEERVRETR